MMPTKCLACPECNEWRLLVIYKHGAGPQGTYSFIRGWEEVQCRTSWKYATLKSGEMASEQGKKLWAPSRVHLGGGLEARGDTRGSRSLPVTLHLTDKTLPRRCLTRPSQRSRADMLSLRGRRERLRDTDGHNSAEVVGPRPKCRSSDSKFIPVFKASAHGQTTQHSSKNSSHSWQATMCPSPC